MTISVLRTIILYGLLIVAMRLMGKRQLGELQPTELVVTLLLSDLAAVPMQENGLPLLNGVLPILVLVSLELLISGAMLKSPKIARLVSGSPLPIIQDGKVDEGVMRRLRISVDDLLESLRQQDIFDIRQVQYAIAETNGHISVFQYPKTGEPPKQMPVVVITDGALCAWGMQLCGLTEEKLGRILHKEKCRQEDVFLMTATKDGQHHLLTRAQVKGGGG
ncbi:MAG: DUF421 domain-containing protein [Ruminococcaceae bacterium]|nr:DUF421 domain-containing protein [Oscillospiraceae bacterium]